MNDITDRLDAYPVLAPHERDAVDAYVATHPEWADALAEARTLTAVLDRAREDVRPVDVAEAVVGQALGQPVGADVEAALASDPGLEAHAETVRQRMETLAAEMESPLAQFERLTGRGTPHADSTSVEARRADRFGAARPAADRAAEPTVRPGRLRLAWARPLAYAAVLLMVAYSGLFLYSTNRLSDRDRLADLGALAEYEPLNLRGGEPDDLDGRLNVVLDGIGDTRRSTLGLFPRYDVVALDAVAAHLEDIVSAAAPGSSVHEEALFALARVRVAQDREAPARAALTAVVEGGGARAPEARRLLDALGEAE